MPINQVVSNESIKQVCRSGEQPPKPPQPEKGSSHMARASTFCRCPEDLEGCRQSLIQAWREGSIGEYCIMEGLRANLHQCRQVLLEGLYDKTSQPKGSAGKVTEAVRQKKDFEEACKHVVLLGYPLEIGAIGEVFYEAYYNLVRTIIHRFGIKDDSQPSADDVSQQVLTNLHEHFRKGVSVERPLAAYITSVTVYECFRWLKDVTGHINLSEDQVQIETSLSTTLLPPSVVECWEDLDQRLFRSEQGNLINRIIFAQQCLEACNTGKRPSAKQLMADWQTLSQMPGRDVASLHERTVMHVMRSPARDVVHIAADLINAGLAASYQMAIVFAASMGMDLKQTEELLEHITSLSASAVYARICRIYMVLQPPGMEEQ